MMIKDDTFRSLLQYVYMREKRIKVYTKSLFDTFAIDSSPSNLRLIAVVLVTLTASPFPFTSALGNFSGMVGRGKFLK